MIEQNTITILNPHADDFLSIPLSFWLIGRKSLKKYEFILQEPIRRGLHVQLFVDGTLSSVIDQSVFANFPAWIRKIILRIEIAIWLRINKITNNVSVHWSLDSIRNRSLIYVFSYKNCVGSFDQRKLAINEFTNALINLSHYFIRTSEKAANIDSLSNAILHVDSDLSDNKYFRTFFPNPPPLIVLPFSVGSRFVVKRPPSKRSLKCVATGTFHNLSKEHPSDYYRDFINFFKKDTYHPIRKALFQRRTELTNWLECYVWPYRELNGKRALSAKLKSLLQLDVVQSGYFSVDLVCLYNQYQFAIIGEEITGAPALGFFEAMACGCICLGSRGSYYDGLGLQPEVHYIEHDGSVESIRAAISRISASSTLMQAIVCAGQNYIAKHCTPEANWANLLASLKRIADRQCK